MSSLEYEINLLSKMVEIDTESVSKKGYDKCASIIVEEAEQNQLDVEIINGEKGAKDGLSRPNVIVTLDAGSDVTLLLESHFDVVPPGPNWTYPPFKLTVKDGKAYGRGSADNKSGIAAAMGAMRQLKKEKLDINLKLVAGVDEEIGGRYGADYVMSDYGLKGDAALVVDSGLERLYLGASGILWGKITVKGKQGHAGYPFKAKNAINETIKLLTALEPYKNAVEKKESTLHAPPEAPRQFIWGRYTVTMIRGGEKENVIPGTCEARFDRRLLPEEPVEEAEKELRNYFQQAVEKTGCQASLEIINKFPGYHTPKNLVFVQTVSENIKKTIGQTLPLAAELGGNDGSFFAKNGIPVVCYGTIRADTCYHGLDEFVHLEDVKNVRDLIINLGRSPREKIA
ncbi:MAG: ArgE/DapE family deacylase [Candidatus Bathyarchaeota archaeon]|nr:ArgE/DapE family deacylase [Candidatus Bathyarchaeota archaeon]MDH5494597.1 ArgE/DapE family deacylase [Candidatus Bathyarchaeota archaeon]